MVYITVALAKGRLAKKAMEILEKAGIFCDEMKDPDTRKLIFTNEELKMKFFLAKAGDVPTYVEYGAADIGIVGKDTILEEGHKLYEVIDFGIGRCRTRERKEPSRKRKADPCCDQVPEHRERLFYECSASARRDHQTERLH